MKKTIAMKRTEQMKEVKPEPIEKELTPIQKIEEKIKVLESDEQKLVGQLNMTKGAINMLKVLQKELTE